MPKIATEWQRFDDLTGRQLYELLSFRQRIFVLEQRCPYPDLDGLDQAASHLLLWAEGALSACLGSSPCPCGSAGSPSLYRSGGTGSRAG